MKNNAEKDRLPEIITAAVAVLAAVAVIFTQSAGRVTLAVAQAMYRSGRELQTHIATAQSTSETAK